MISHKKILKSTIWNRPCYYKKCRNINQIYSQDSYINKLKSLLKNNNYILDCGCGEGSLLKYFAEEFKYKFYGVDISSLAIKLAKSGKRKNNIRFQSMDLEKLRFPSNKFDLVYSAYVLEHLDNPERAVKEMIRVCKFGGYIVFISPNFGSPIDYRLSIISRGKISFLRYVKRFIKTYFYILFKPVDLDWEKINPKLLAAHRWESDWDTVTAPYLQTLIYFLKKQKIQIIDSSEKNITSTIWEEKNDYTLYLKIIKIFRFIFKNLGNIGLSPYKYYGETLFIVGRKTV